MQPRGGPQIGICNGVQNSRCPRNTRKIYAGCPHLTQIPTSKIRCCGCHIHIHTDYRDPVGEKGRRGHSLKRRGPLSASATPSRGEHPNPCLDKLLLVFQAPYIKEGPLLLCKGLFWVVIFADEGGHLQCKGRSGPNS